MGKGGRQEDFPAPQHGLEPPGITQPPLGTPTTPPRAPLGPTPGEDEEGHPQSPAPAEGDAESGAQPRAPQTRPGGECREPPVTQSGCLRGITRLLPSALIQGLNIPGPGIKIGTIWEGPESAASAGGTHRHPPRHARHPPAAAPAGFAAFGDTHGDGGAPKRALCVSRCQPCACWSEQRGPPGMLRVPKRG